MSNYNESQDEIAKATSDYVMQQTMLRIKDPKVSLAFYQNVLGMKLLGKYDFPTMQFTLYFLGYEQAIPEGDDKEKSEGESPAEGEEKPAKEEAAAALAQDDDAAAEEKKGSGSGGEKDGEKPPKGEKPAEGAEKPAKTLAQLRRRRAHH